YTLGKATQGLSQYLLESYPDETVKVVIAYDCRNNSQSLARVVADVFTANGIHAYLFSDLRPTPELSFAVRELKAHCGIVLTASHNPPKYNGYKVYNKNGGQLVPPQDTEIIKKINSTPFESIRFEGNNKLLNSIDQELDEAYHKTVLQEAQMHSLPKDDFKIVFTPIHGTSITALPQVLEKAGYENVLIVKEQAKPDGNFPTVVSPNPEEPEALAMAVDLANEHNADMIIGTDPDADRLGIIIKDPKEEWYYLNGNQIMMVLTEYLLQKKKNLNDLNENHFIASTIVSTPAIEKMAKAYGIQFKNCLTGFKWIAKLIHDFSELEFIGGGEESFGYLVGHQVRDKDAISASLLAVEIGAEAKNQGSNFFELMVRCYQKYGAHKERLVSIIKEGKEGLKSIRHKMELYRVLPPKEIAGKKVTFLEDYDKRVRFDIKNQSEESIPLPKANVLIFILEDGSRIALRPSGTEPKIKFYYSVNQEFNPKLTWKVQEELLDRQIDKLVAETASL
ncbi:MAG: phospho-sugar mutase, partial [Flavobacteriaceae bacterium]